MRKYLAPLMVLLAAALLFAGCSTGDDYSVSGIWRLTSLQDFDTGTVYDFDEEILNLKDDGTGIEIYKPGDYSEEYSFITWKREISEGSIEVKHSEDYIYDLDIVSVSGSELKCSFFYNNEPDIYYLATYTRIPEDVFALSGCWIWTEYYEDEEYYDSGDSTLYLYPDGSVQEIYYEVEDEITSVGKWSATDKYLILEFDGYESVRYEISINSNRLEIYGATNEGAEVVYVYKRYFGVITNTPPVTYPRSFMGELNRFFAAIFGRVADNLS